MSSQSERGYSNHTRKPFIILLTWWSRCRALHCYDDRTDVRSGMHRSPLTFTGNVLIPASPSDGPQVLSLWGNSWASTRMSHYLCQLPPGVEGYCVLGNSCWLLKWLTCSSRCSAMLSRLVCQQGVHNQLLVFVPLDARFRIVAISINIISGSIGETSSVEIFSAVGCVIWISYLRYTLFCKNNPTTRAGNIHNQ